MKKFFAKARQTIGAVEITEHSPEFVQMEDNLKASNVFYKDMATTSAKMRAQEQSGAQPQAELGNLLAAQKATAPSEGKAAEFVEDTFRKYAEVEKMLANQRLLLAGRMTDEFIAPISRQLEHIKSLKAMRRRMEDARVEYDAARASHAKSSGNTTEVDLEKARKTYERLRSEMTEKMTEVEYQKATELLHQLTAVLRAQKKYHEDSLAILNALEPHWQQLEEQVPRGGEDDELSINVELNLLRLQRTPNTIRENIETSVREELQFLEESGRATGNTTEARLAKVLQDKLATL